MIYDILAELEDLNVEVFRFAAIINKNSEAVGV